MALSLLFFTRMKPQRSEPKQPYRHPLQQANKRRLKASQRRRSLPGHIQLELFQREDDPFCHAVRSRLSRQGLDFVAHNIPNSDALKHEQVTRAGGKYEIPFLIDHRTGVKLYGSSAILAYLDKEYGKVADHKVAGLAHRINTQLEEQRDELVWAMRGPIDQARVLGQDLKETWTAVQGSARLFREILKNAIAS